MPDYAALLDWMRSEPSLQGWAKTLPDQIARGLSIDRWGDMPGWQRVLDELPDIEPSALDFATTVAIGDTADCDDRTRSTLRQTLMGLHPWRKGPFRLFGLHIDTEWRSDWKWDRLEPHLAPLKNRHILDVGCGNGYHCLRLYGAGAARVVGIDPSAKFIFQFSALKRYCPDIPVDVLPLGIEHVPDDLKAFDTVLSMGVIYHRRDPVQHVRELLGCLKPGGQLVLETLIVDDSFGSELVPKTRYGKMRNVWSVPSPALVLDWLSAAGAREPRLVNRAITTAGEQRATDWMHFESLADFLDPVDSSRTIEGYPAPERAIFVAEK